MAKTKPAISVVIAYRDWGGERLRLAVESHLRSTIVNDIEVIVSDFGSASHRRAEKILNGLPVNCVYTDTDEPWSRGRALNIGASVSQGATILAWDADILCTPTLHHELLVYAQRHPKAAWVFQCRDLDESLTEQTVRELLEVEDLFPIETLRRHSMWRPRWGMGIAAYPKYWFEFIRGYDERFEIWGGEDRDILKRLRAIGLPTRWIPSPRAQIFHIYHESSRDKAQQTLKGGTAIRENHRFVREDDSIIRNLEPGCYFSPSHPLVSVVIATYNRAHYVKKSVESVLNQTFRDFELIVVDDGSTDGTAETLKTIDDPRLKILRKENGGVASARNKGLREAKGDFVVVHDDDDIMLPWRLHAHLAAVREGTCGTYGGWIDFDDETGEFLAINRGKHFSEDAIAFAGKTLLHPTVMLARWVTQYVQYDERYTGGSDFSWMMQIASSGVSLTHTGHFHILRRIHPASLTTGGYTQRHAYLASIRKAYSTLSYAAVSKRRSRGKRTSTVTCSEEHNPEALYQYLPHAKGWDGTRFSLSVSLDDLPALVQELQSAAPNTVFDSLAPLGDAAAIVSDVYWAVGWTDDLPKTEEVLRRYSEHYGLYRGPRPRHPRNLRAHEMRPLSTWRGTRTKGPLGTKVTSNLWRLLPEMAQHRRLEQHALMCVVARRQATRRLSFEDVDRLILENFGRMARIGNIEVPDGVIPVYHWTLPVGGAEDPLQNLRNKWILSKLKLWLVEYTAATNEHADDVITQRGLRNAG